MTTTTNTEYQKLLEGEDEFSQKTPLLKSGYQNVRFIFS